MNFHKRPTVYLDFPDHIAGNDDQAALEAKPDIRLSHVVFILPFIIAYLFEVGVNLVGAFDFD